MATRLESYAALVETLNKSVTVERGHITENDAEIAALEVQIAALRSRNETSTIKINNAISELRGVRVLIRTIEDHITAESRRQEDGMVP